jgi:hypothetical protein
MSLRLNSARRLVLSTRNEKRFAKWKDFLTPEQVAAFSQAKNMTAESESAETCEEVVDEKGLRKSVRCSFILTFL